MTPPTEPANSDVVRLAVVNTPQYSGLLDYLLEDFKKAMGFTVEVYSGEDVYALAQAGKADIVISHYGKSEVESFVLGGYGLWPKSVFSNQAVILGPKSDPANIRGLTSGTEAMRRIAASKAPFVAQKLPGIDYLTTVFWEAAGRPDKGDWFQRTELAKAKAVRFAEGKQAYVMWGAFPFLRFTEKHSTDMEIMVAADPLMQRVMASVLVNPKMVEGVNAAGAKALQHFLLRPQTQAKIAAHSWPGSDLQLWWPAARDNNPKILPK